MPAAARQYSESPAASQVAARPASHDDWRQAVPLLEHFQENALAIEQARHEREQQVVRRARRMHRPLRLRVTLTAVAVAVTFVLLVGVLWLNGLAQAGVRHVRALDQEIERTRDENERTKKKIAILDSTIRLEPLAAQKGWKLATQSDFDDVTRSPLALPEAAPRDGVGAAPDDEPGAGGDE